MSINLIAGVGVIAGICILIYMQKNWRWWKARDRGLNYDEYLDEEIDRLEGLLEASKQESQKLKEENTLTLYMNAYGLKDLKRTAWCSLAMLFIIVGVLSAFNWFEGWVSFEKVFIESIVAFITTSVIAVVTGVSLRVYYLRKNR